MTFSIMFWNVQGVVSRGFRRSFGTLIKAFSPEMVVLLEPQMSGAKADNFIKHSGFDRSHRVEVEGFLVGLDTLEQCL